MTAVTATLTCPNGCGWTTTNRTQGIAEYALRRHQCDTHLERLARTARAQTRAADPGHEQPCTHTPQHAHGTSSRYVVDRCRCRTCRDATAARARARTRDRIYGRPPRYVPADPIRAHIAALQAAGMGWKRIARTAGLPESTVWKLLYGDPHRGQTPSRRVTTTTASKILATTLNLAPRAHIDGTGTRRRLQALAAAGWSLTRLATHLGVTPRNLLSTMTSTGDVTAARAATVTALYDRLWDANPATDATRYQRSAITVTKRAAARHGWVPPLAWDDEQLDDPTATPHHATAAPAPAVDEVDDIAVARATAGDPPAHLTTAERLAAVTELWRQGLNDHHIAERLHTTSRQVIRDRVTLNLPTKQNTRKDTAA